MSLDRARIDAKRIIEGGFSESVKFINKTNSSVNATVRALAMKHHFSIDIDSGTPRSTRNNHITVYESSLTTLNYPTRSNTTGEISMRGDKVQYNSKTYLISEAISDDTIGTLTFILVDFSS